MQIESTKNRSPETCVTLRVGNWKGVNQFRELGGKEPNLAIRRGTATDRPSYRYNCCSGVVAYTCFTVCIVGF